MVSKELLEILVCPETRQSLTPADAALVAQLNAAVVTGKLANRAGQGVKHKFTGGLVRQDGQYLYPIVDDIPLMLVDEAIPLAQLK